MKPKFISGLLLVCCLVLGGCNYSEIELGPKKELTSYSEKTIQAGDSLNLYIENDSGNIEVYSWKKKQVKFEITNKVRGIQTQEVLEKDLEEFVVYIDDTEDNKVYFKSRYNGSIKNPADAGTDIKIYIPKKVKYLSFKLDIGRIKIYDDIECEMDIEVNMANVDINRFEGLVNMTADMGDLKISGGRIMSGSSVSTGMGNIRIKAEHEGVGDFVYKTDMGSIELLLPSRSNVCFESIGSLEVNEFSAYSSPTKIKVKSGMGRISIKKY